MGQTGTVLPSAGSNHERCNAHSQEPAVESRIGRPFCESSGEEVLLGTHGRLVADRRDLRRRPHLPPTGNPTATGRLVWQTGPHQRPGFRAIHPSPSHLAGAHSEDRTDASGARALRVHGLSHLGRHRLWRSAKSRFIWSSRPRAAVYSPSDGRKRHPYGGPTARVEWGSCRVAKAKKLTTHDLTPLNKVGNVVVRAGQ